MKRVFVIKRETPWQSGDCDMTLLYWWNNAVEMYIILKLWAVRIQVIPSLLFFLGNQALFVRTFETLQYLSQQMSNRCRVTFLKNQTKSSGLRSRKWVWKPVACFKTFSNSTNYIWICVDGLIHKKKHQQDCLRVDNESKRSMANVILALGNGHWAVTTLTRTLNCFSNCKMWNSFACHVVAILYYSTGIWQHLKKLSHHMLCMY